jgi:hypothetical protein
VATEGFRAPVAEGEALAAEPFVAEMEGEKIKTGVGEIKPTINLAEVEGIAKHNSTFKTQVAANAPRLEVEFLEENIPHMFDDRPGHLPDTAENRALFRDLAADQDNYFAKADSHGTLWCERLLEDGTQLWAQIRDGKIRNCGHNKIPRKWDTEAGLTRNIKK